MTTTNKTTKKTEKTLLPLDGRTRVRKNLRALVAIFTVFALAVCAIVPAFADNNAGGGAGGGAGNNDPLSILTNLTEFVLTVIQALGVLAVVFGLVQVGISFTQHDPSQRLTGFMFLVGGLFFLCAKYIVNLIAPGTITF